MASCASSCMLPRRRAPSARLGARYALRTVAATPSPTLRHAALRRVLGVARSRGHAVARLDLRVYKILLPLLSKGLARAWRGSTLLCAGGEKVQYSTRYSVDVGRDRRRRSRARRAGAGARPDGHAGTAGASIDYRIRNISSVCAKILDGLLATALALGWPHGLVLVRCCGGTPPPTEQLGPRPQRRYRRACPGGGPRRTPT